MPIEVGTLLESRYKIEKLIGQGGTADVFLANDIVNKKQYAIKVLKANLSENNQILENFKKEVTILSCLTSEHIVRVYGYYLFENRPYIVNEYVKGNTLKDALDLRGLLPVDEALDYMIQLTRALAPAHAKGVIHRDVKPLNMFILNDGTLKLADFGIAEINNEKSLNSSKTIVGSVQYLAPEITLGKPACIASDVYSCGICLYEMLSGRVPYEKDTTVDTAMAHVKEPFPSISKIMPNCPKDIEYIINKCTMKNPDERYLSVEDLYNDLSKVKSGESLVPKKVGFFSRLFGGK